MGTLRDEAYEKLDYLSQLTEVVVGPQNEALSQIADRIELSFDDIKNLKYGSYMGAGRPFTIDVNRVLRSKGKIQWDIVGQIADNFEFEVSPDFEIDFKSQMMVGCIALVKKNNQIDEKRLLQLAIEDATRELYSHKWPSSNLKHRAMTVLNTLEAGRGTAWLAKLNGRVSQATRNEVSTLLEEVILDNKWRIRDVSVIVKMGKWINSYLSDEDNGIGLVNLMKLKIMIDKDLPVYSIDEVKSGNPG